MRTIYNPAGGGLTPFSECLPSHQRGRHSPVCTGVAHQASERGNAHETQQLQPLWLQGGGPRGATEVERAQKIKIAFLRPHARRGRVESCRSESEVNPMRFRRDMVMLGCGKLGSECR